MSRYGLVTTDVVTMITETVIARIIFDCVATRISSGSCLAFISHQHLFS